MPYPILDWTIAAAVHAKGAGRREDLFAGVCPDRGCPIFGMVCQGTGPDGLDCSETGRSTHIAGSKQFGPGMVRLMEEDLPFCCFTYPGPVADVTIPDIIIGT